MWVWTRAMLGTLNQHGLNQSVSNAQILYATPCNLKFPCKCVLCHFQFFHWPCVQVRLCYSLGQVDASCLKSEPVCRSELADFIENHAVYDGHNMTSSAGKTSNVWHFEPILEHMFSYAKRHVFLCEFVFRRTWKSVMWSSVV